MACASSPAGRVGPAPVLPAFMLAGLMALASLVQAQEPAPELRFSAQHEGEFVVVAASIELPVEQDVVWRVLTDYESYPRFISSMSVSRVVARSAAGLVLEQKGEFGILFFSQPVGVRLLVAEFPPRVVVARLVEGSFREFIGRYELQPYPGGVRLVYRARFIPDFRLPPLIGMTAVRFGMQRDFQQLTDEILRRAPRSVSPARAGK